MRQEIITLLRRTRNLLSYHLTLGLDEYPRSPALESFLQGEPPIDPGSGRSREKAGAETPAASPPAATPDRTASRCPAELVISPEELQRELAACRRCSLAAQTSLRVPGEGSSESGLLIIADLVPPAEGALAGPEAGPAAELLTRMLAAIGLPRRTVYITALPKCRPSREPSPEELRNCLTLLHREIEVLAPRIICTMGPFAARTVLTTGATLFKLRGRFHRFLDRPLMPTFHPAYLLRNPEMKKAAWHDLQAIRKELNLRQR